ncbi:MAG: hypothetical protein ACRDIC_19700 [bacterium]
METPYTILELAPKPLLIRHRIALAIFVTVIWGPAVVTLAIVASPAWAAFVLIFGVILWVIERDRRAMKSWLALRSSQRTGSERLK